MDKLVFPMKLLDMMGGGEELNPHQIAWTTRDWKAIDKLVEEYKENEENVFFQLLNALTYTKDRQNVNGVDYSKYNVDNMMSRHPDCVYAAFMMNMFGDALPDQAHYDYYHHTIASGKRYNKGMKLNEDLENKAVIALLCKYYSVSTDTAFMYKELLENKDNLTEVKRKMKGLATESFVKTIAKTKADQCKIIKIVEKW